MASEMLFTRGFPGPVFVGVDKNLLTSVCKHQTTSKITFSYTHVELAIPSLYKPAINLLEANGCVKCGVSIRKCPAEKLRVDVPPSSD